MDQFLTRFLESDKTSEEGIIYVSSVVNQLGWIWREVVKHDVGIDGYIEIVEGTQPTHQLIEVQVKSGDSYIRAETPTDFRFKTDVEHMMYWTKSPIPVVVVVYSPRERSGYWVHVQSLGLNATETSGPVTFTFPKQPFDSTARAQLSVLPQDSKPWRILPPRLTYSFAESDGEKRYPMIPVILSSDTKATSTLGIVDSGSEYLVIPAKLAEYLDLKKERVRYVDSVGGREEVLTATVDLRLPGGQPIPAECLVSSSVPSVVLGRSPLFEDHRVTVDYRRGTVSFEPQG